MNISITELEDISRRAIKKFGYDDQEAKIILDVLMYAQLRDNNQGVVKLIGSGFPKISDAAGIKVIKETALSAQINGNQNHAMIVMTKAVDIVISKTLNSGLAVAGIFNTSTSSGAIGYYASRIALKGLIGIVFSRSPQRVAAFGSYEPVFGTNPIAISIPSESDPITLDMSTAATSYFGLVEAMTAGRKIPADIAYDNKGNPTTDPKEAIAGAIRSFDRSYKGSGLALIAEILAGPLVGAAFCGIGNSRSNWGHLLIAIDPDILAGRERLKKDISEIIMKVKLTKKLPGVEELFLPGEKENRIAAKRLATGMIEIEDVLLEQLRNVI